MDTPLGAKSWESISLVTSATFGKSNFAVSLTNVLLPTSTDDDSHKNLGVPEYHEPLTIKVREHIHIEIGKLGSDNFCSAKVPASGFERQANW